MLSDVVDTVAAAESQPMLSDIDTAVAVESASMRSHVASLAAEIVPNLADARAMHNRLVDRLPVPGRQPSTGQPHVDRNWLAGQVNEMGLRFERLNGLQQAVDGVSSIFDGEVAVTAVTVDMYDAMLQPTLQLESVVAFADGMGLLSKCQPLLHYAEVACIEVAEALQLDLNCGCHPQPPRPLLLLLRPDWTTAGFAPIAHTLREIGQ